MSPIKPLGNLIIYGANTDVGKTVVSTGLVKAALAVFDKVVYCKPLQTGTGRGDSDINTILKFCNSEQEKSKLASKELFSWKEPVSPHVAAADDPNVPSDFQVRKEVDTFLLNENASTSFIETAGGVLSPGALGTPQADLYRESFSEALLVGDGKLGGISTTLSALEALENRNYNVRGIIMIEESADLGNSEYIKSQWKGSESRVISLPGLPPLHEPLDQWYKDTSKRFHSILRCL